MAQQENKLSFEIPVEITLHSNQVAFGEKEEMKQTFQGKMIQKNEGYYVLYKEILYEEKLTIRHMIHISQNEIVVTKTGALKSQMKFSEKKEFAFPYQTPVGEFQMNIFTKYIHIPTLMNEMKEIMVEDLIDLIWMA